MIIGREHRYVFVELPRTGSTAVAKELLSQYGGERILRKHSTYVDFARIASHDEKQFFVFSSVRNPLDDAVSHFFKLKTDHHGRFSDPVRMQYRVGNKGADAYRATGTNRRGERPRRRTFRERSDNRKYEFVRRRDAEFSEFFLRYHWLPYDNWSRLSHADLDFVIRFENLQEDFAEALDLIGLPMTRPLPVINKTAGKSSDYLRYYTPATVARAKRVYGPYMRRWGYEFPPEWGQVRGPHWEDMVYDLLALPRSVYWKYLRKGG